MMRGKRGMRETSGKRVKRPLTQLVLPLTALVIVGLIALPVPDPPVLPPPPTLGLDQRDLRVYDSFGLPAGAAHASFPGQTGAPLAIWKAAVEWGSVLHGDGAGDPYQPGGLGSGGANFDPSWQGLAPGPGGPDDNVHSPVATSPTGILAYCELPVSDGWRIRYSSGAGWSAAADPAALAGWDLQGVATHEIGHALGLGHLANLGATMSATATGGALNQRSIETADRVLLQALYGAAAADKPRITGTTLTGGALELTGFFFAATGNEVWFTLAAGSTTGNAAGEPLKVTGLPSTAGGTRLALGLPPGAGPGDVLVRRPGTAHSDLSNAWPFDPAVPGTTGGPPLISAATPSSVAAVTAVEVQVLLVGSGFAGVHTTRVAGVDLAPEDWSILGAGQLELVLPPQPGLGPVTVEVESAAGPSNGFQVEVVAAEPPVLVLDDPVLLSSKGVQLTLGGSPGDVAWVLVSLLDTPSVWPGLVQLAIGGQFTQLSVLATVSVPVSGRVELALPLAGLPWGTPLHFQAALFDASQGSLPLLATDAVTGTFYF